jgi:Pyruvate/2-oxoacid:ferredoxin oxidoreductase gamma subunit
VRDAAIALEREGFGPVSSTEDLQEGVSAFTEKRKPIFLDGRADVILGFEPLETLRNLKSALEKTLVLMNNEAISPPGLTTKMMNYPSLEEITEKIHGFTKNLVVMEAAKLVKKPEAS